MSDGGRHRLRSGIVNELKYGRMAYHKAVLLQACVEGLQVKPGGVYVDATFGGGGHSRAILRELEDGVLIVFDQDEDVRANLPDDDRIHFVPENFRHLKRFLRLAGYRQVDGVLADLGISSHQIDTPQRGFSTRFDAPLDMRMDKRLTKTAADFLQALSRQGLVRVLSEYGEVRNAKRLASAIVAARKDQPIRRIRDLLDIMEPLTIGRKERYRAQVFQALRILVNDEMAALRAFLEQSAGVIRPHGRLVVLSYHSLEDRLVKQYMKHGRFDREPLKDVYGKPLRPFVPVNKKPLEASAQEVRENPRARSAKLRIAERVAETEEH